VTDCSQSWTSRPSLGVCLGRTPWHVLSQPSSLRPCKVRALSVLYLLRGNAEAPRCLLQVSVLVQPSPIKPGSSACSTLNSLLYLLCLE